MVENCEANVDQRQVRIILCQLKWRLMQDRRKAIRAIEQCIQGLFGLRDVLGCDAVDKLTDAYSEVLCFIRSINPESPPSQGEVIKYETRLIELQKRLTFIVMVGNQRLQSPIDLSHLSVQSGDFLSTNLTD